MNALAAVRDVPAAVLASRKLRNQVANNIFWGVHTALSKGAAASVLMVGDSWFWYPVDNLVTELGSLFATETFVIIGKNGAEAADWSQGTRKAINFGFEMFASSSKTLILSGGGNDIAGQDDFLRLLKTDCSKFATFEECWRATQPIAAITGIINAYREVIVRFRAYNKTAPVVLHNYDNAWPSGKGFFGPADWLKVPMDFAKVQPALRRDLFKALVTLLGDAQQELSTQGGLGPIVAVRTAGELPEAGPTGWWANELHPTPKGFRRIAQNRLQQPLQAILG